MANVLGLEVKTCSWRGALVVEASGDDDDDDDDECVGERTSSCWPRLLGLRTIFLDFC